MDDIVTNPNPLLLPLILSYITSTISTVPACSNNSARSALSTLKGRLPTKIFKSGEKLVSSRPEEAWSNSAATLVTKREDEHPLLDGNEEEIEMGLVLREEERQRVEDGKDKQVFLPVLDKTRVLIEIDGRSHKIWYKQIDGANKKKKKIQPLKIT